MNPGFPMEGIEAQHRALTERVRASGLYRHEVAEFEIAVAGYQQLSEVLGITTDLGSLTSHESRNLVRHVRTRDGHEAVLKVIGNTREPGEGEVLDAWFRMGLPTVRPLAWGYRRVASRGTKAATWLLTEYLPAPDLTPQTGTDEATRQRIEELLNLLRPFHDSDIRVRSTRSWNERLAPHLKEVLPLVRGAGLVEPRGWQDALADLSRRGHTVVHGDPAPINVLAAADGWRLIDPPGAVMAMPEADAAKIAWHVGGPGHLREAVEAACDADPHLLPPAVAAFASFELLVWAGYELVDHDIEGRESGTSSLRQDLRDRAQAWLDAGTDLLNDY